MQALQQWSMVYLRESIVRASALDIYPNNTGVFLAHVSVNVVVRMRVRMCNVYIEPNHYTFTNRSSDKYCYRRYGYFSFSLVITS